MMMRPARLACVGALVAIGVAGCGGGGGSAQYTLAATRTCMTKAGFQASAVSNSSLPGSGGDLRVHLASGPPGLLTPEAARGGVAANEFVILVFDKDSAAALATEKRAVSLALMSLRAYGQVITRKAMTASVGLTRNVFYYSLSGPLTAGQRAKVTACLH